MSGSCAIPNYPSSYKITGSSAPKWVNGNCKNDFDDDFAVEACIASQGVAYQWREKELYYRGDKPETQCVMVTPTSGDKIKVMSDDSQCDAHAGIGYGRFSNGTFGGMACFKTRKTGERINGRAPVADHLCPTTSRNGTYRGAQISGQSEGGGSDQSAGEL